MSKEELAIALSDRILSITFDEYRKLERMNASTLVYGLKSMLALRHAMSGEGKEPTALMQFGNKYHKLILEPDEFEAGYDVMPNYAAMRENVTGTGSRSESWGTNFCKDSKRIFLAYAEDNKKEVITRDEYDRGLAMRRAVARHPLASRLVRECRKELTLLGEIDDVPFKCRLDLCGQGVIADIKGTTDVTPSKFGNIAARLNYAFRLSLYREVFRQNFGAVKDVFLIAVETAGDFDCCVYEIPDAVLDDGLSKARKVLERFKLCLDCDRWPGVDKGNNKIPIFVPNWAMPDDEDFNWEEVDGR